MLLPTISWTGCLRRLALSLKVRVAIGKGVKWGNDSAKDYIELEYGNDLIYSSMNS